MRLRLSAMGTEAGVLKNQVENEIEKLQKIIPDDIYGFDNETMAEVVGRLLKQQGKTLAVAESCTGGYISHLITSVPGSSEYYKGSVTAYSNDVKKNILGVSENSLMNMALLVSRLRKKWHWA